MLNELRLSIRSLLRRPGFTLVAALAVRSEPASGGKGANEE